MPAGWLVFVGAAGLIAIAPYAGMLGLFGLVALMRRKPPAAAMGNAESPRFAFVVPAHDEETMIGVTLASLGAVSYPRDRFETVVIADNCTDRTAAVARDAGAYVIERHHATRRSKGYALEEIIPQLLSSEKFAATDAFIVVDADTKVRADCLNILAGLVRGGADWIQGFYTVLNPEESWRTKLMAYGFCLFNGSFQAGSEGLGLGGHLRGNGMCLSRRGLERKEWISGGLAEDLEFSWQLRLAGEHVTFGHDAVFMGEMTSNVQASASQRLRWEKGRHGLWQVLRGRVLAAKVPLLKKLLWVLDLTMPSLTVVVGVYVLSAMILLAGALLSAVVPAWLWALCGILGLGFAFYAVSPFLVFELPWSILGALTMVPYYAVWRLIVALGRGPATWVRTARKSSSGE